MPRKSRKNVGLIGLGIIGTRVASGLRAAGFSVFVWNRTPKPAPNFMGSPAEVAGLCEIVQIFVADAQALFDVIEQMSEALTSRHLVICNATVGPEATIEAARLVEARGAAFLDAPFTGSKGAAEKRELVYYLGGDEASCLRARPVLEATSRALVHIGDIGHAATIKVVTNMIAAVSTQTLAEALAIVQKAGLEPEVLNAALEHNACRSGTMEMKLPKMIAGDYEPHFSLKHMFKDVQLGIHVANALDIEIPATTVTAGVMYGALNQGCGELDYAALYKVYEPQVKAAATALPGAAPRLEDLERRAEHAPEMRFATPPRTGNEEKKAEAPSLAVILNAPEETKAAAPEQPAAPSPPAAKSSETAPSATNLAPPGSEPEAETSKDAKEPAGREGDQPGTSEFPPPAAPRPRVELPAGKPKTAAIIETVAEKPLPAVERHPGDEKPVEGREIPVTAGAERTGRANGAAEDEGGGRPLNFVRRWFVSRGG